mgnify:CR=1 FL=1
MKKIYLFEFYVILQDGSWTLKDNIRFSLYDKRKKLADLKRKGYIYDRIEKAYILKSDPFESCYNYAVVIKSYEA